MFKASGCPILNISGDCSLTGILTGFGPGELARFNFIGTVTGGSLAGAGLPFHSYSTVAISIANLDFTNFDFTKDGVIDDGLGYGGIIPVAPTAVIPIPASFYLLGAGVAALVTTGRRRKMQIGNLEYT